MLINTLILYLKIQICLFELSKTDKLITFYSIPIELLLCLEHNPSDQENISFLLESEVNLLLIQSRNPLLLT